MKIGFIGAGKVGFSLGKLFSEKGVCVAGYYNRHMQEALKAAEFTGSEHFEDVQRLIDVSDVLFITVADGAINSVYEQIKGNIKGKIICHCSGAMTALEAFPDIEKYDAYGFSVHPLFPVSDKYTAYEKLSDAFFCLEGSKEKLSDVEKLISDLGVKVRIISADSKIKYHAACAIASNLYCALMAESVELLLECGFEERDALDALSPLVNSNLSSILEKGAENALTGPVERNDYETVLKHLGCFDSQDEKRMYAAVSQKLVKIAENRHPDRDYAELKKCLDIF